MYINKFALTFFLFMTSALIGSFFLSLFFALTIENLIHILIKNEALDVLDIPENLIHILIKNEALDVLDIPIIFIVIFFVIFIALMYLACRVLSIILAEFKFI